MQLKPIVQGLAVVWLMLFVVSFIAQQTAASDGGASSGLNRVVAFLTWQTAAFIVAVLGALATRFALQRGVAGIKLVGIDYLSIEKGGSPGHPVHVALLEKEIVILEGVDLREVPPGDYEIVCLPLKYEGGRGDGSPARTVLIKR